LSEGKWRIRGDGIDRIAFASQKRSLLGIKAIRSIEHTSKENHALGGEHIRIGSVLATPDAALSRKDSCGNISLRIHASIAAKVIPMFWTSITGIHGRNDIVSVRGGRAAFFQRAY
jgi:hypothetical protein